MTNLNLVLLIAAGLVGIIVFNALDYVFALPHRRRYLEEEDRLRKTYWAYEYRGLFRVGVAFLVAGLIQRHYGEARTLSTFTTAGIFLVAGLIAQIVFMVQSRSRRLNASVRSNP